MSLKFDFKRKERKTKLYFTFRTPETSPPGGYMTLESFMLSRQEEERRHQLQHPRATNVLRVPQCHAPPPPTPIISHNVAAATGMLSFLRKSYLTVLIILSSIIIHFILTCAGREHFSSAFHYNSRSHNNLSSNVWVFFEWPYYCRSFC